MRAYIDESGNTGVNLFDPDQPYFLNVAMSSPVDFDEVFRERVARLAHAVGVDYLHASEMGVGRVESIAQSLIVLIQFAQVRFYFTSVKKPDVAVMKFFDAIFDPGENPAAPHHGYYIRELRFLLLLKFAAILEPDDTELFWMAMMRSRPPESESAAVSAIDNVLRRINVLPDARSRQLIGETLSWARDNIGSFSFWRLRKQQRYGNLPNLFTLPALVYGISKAAMSWDSKVDGIIHDQQSQFGRTLKQWHSSSLQWHSLFQSTDAESMDYFETFFAHTFKDMPSQLPYIRESQFGIADSKDSPGLQVVDVVLWLVSRVVASKSIGPSSSELLELCVSADDMFVMSLDWIAAGAKDALGALMSRPMSEEQLRVGKQAMKRIEELRQDRISEATIG